MLTYADLRPGDLVSWGYGYQPDAFMTKCYMVVSVEKRQNEKVKIVWFVLWDAFTQYLVGHNVTVICQGFSQVLYDRRDHVLARGTNVV